MNTRKRQADLRQKTHFHLTQLINSVNSLRLIDLAEVYQSDKGELYANKHLHKVFDSLDAYYVACKKHDDMRLKDDGFCKVYLEKYGRKPKKVGDDVERFVEVLEEDIGSIKGQLDCSAGEGAKKCGIKLTYLADSRDIFDHYRFLFNQIAQSFAVAYQLTASDVEPDALNGRVDEWRNTHRSSHVGDPKAERDQLKQACHNYLEHLKLNILSEAGMPKQADAQGRGRREVELGVKRENHDAFSSSDDNRFARQLKQLRGMSQDNHVLTLAIKKYDEMARLQAILTNESLNDRAALEKFENRYKYAKPLLEKRRDTAVSLFFKVVASIFTLCAANFFIWRVHGRELTARIDKRLGGLENKMLKR